MERGLRGEVNRKLENLPLKDPQPLPEFREGSRQR
jgi:hypothetical protein